MTPLCPIITATIVQVVSIYPDRFSTVFVAYLDGQKIGTRDDKSAAAALVETEIARRVRDGSMSEDYDGPHFEWKYSEVVKA